MKIRAIGPKILNNRKVSKQINSAKNITVKEQNFTGLFNIFSHTVKNEKKKEEQFAQNFFFGYGKVPAKTCEDIISNHPLTLTKAYKFTNQNINGDKRVLSQTPDITARGGFTLKRFFDEKYGNNYRIVSIGTSPAILAKAMEYLGAEVIYLPISGAGQLEQTNSTKTSTGRRREILDIRNVKIILDYFKSKIPKNDNKINVVLDYIATGASLINIAQLLKEKSGLSKDKFEAYSISGAFEEFFEKFENSKISGVFADENDIYQILDDCNTQAMEHISNVPHFYIDDEVNQNWIKSGHDDYISSKGKDEKSVFWEFENYSTRLGRAYNLCIYNEMKKMGLV